MQSQETKIIPLRSDVGGQISHVKNSGQREYYRESWEQSESTTVDQSGFRFVVSAVGVVAVLSSGMIAYAIHQKPTFDNQQLQADLSKTQTQLTARESELTDIKTAVCGGQ